MKKLCGLMGLIVLVQAGYRFGFFNGRPYLTPTSSPTNSLYINWNTESEESTIIAYGLTVSLEDTLRITGVRNYHHVELAGLTPGTQYFYQILPIGDLKQFRTFPAQVDTFSFAVFGDTRTDSVAHQSVIDQIALHEYMFVLHSGDLVEDGNNEIDWRIFFNIEDTLLQNKQFIPAIGNHESPFWPYDTLFALPGIEEYYSIEYGNSHLIVLNTEMDLYGAQLTWLIDDLTAAHNDSTIDWIFVNFHRPPYSSGNHGSQMDVRDAWCSVFAQHDVDIVFSGHDHDYERTVPIDDVVYIVTGGGGAPLRHVDSSSWTAYSESTYHFCHIDIEDRNLVLRAIKPDGTIFDSLFICKPVGIDEEQTSNYRTQKPLLEVQPNPFTHSTVIELSLGRSAEGTELSAKGMGLNENSIGLSVYDAAGREVKSFNVLTAYSLVPAVFSWDGSNNAGHNLPSGVYFLRCRTCGFSSTRKLLLIRK